VDNYFLLFFFSGRCSSNLYGSLNVIMQLFVVEFKPSQQALLVVGNVHNRMIVSLQRCLLSSPSEYDISGSFV
jgi:hypothetical protein